MNKELTIIIPCYNEEKNLPEIIEKCGSISSDQLKFILVNNGSKDKTYEIFSKVRNTNILIMNIEKNIGYGNGIIQGLKLAQSEFVGWTHADLQTDLKDVIKAMSFIKNKENLFIKGKRKNRNFKSNLLTFCMSIFETLIFQRLLYDINAQPTIFNRNLLKYIDNPPNDFMLDLYFYIKAIENNFKIQKFDVFFYKRKHGLSNWDFNFKNKIKTIFNAIVYSLKLRKNFD